MCVCVLKVAFDFSVAGIGLYRLLAYLSTPVALVKTAISLLHGYVSCINLGIIDVKERQERLKAN